MGVNRKEFALVIAALCVVWIGLLVGLSRWQQRRAVTHPPSQPDFPHYPGTEDVPEQTSTNLGWRKYWFHLNEDYPSLSVFKFYQSEMRARGWRLMGDRQPRWHRQDGGEEVHDILEATWIAPDRLFQLDLQMLATAMLTKQEGRVLSEDRAPGIKVYVTIRRVIAPGLIVPQPGRVTPRPGIAPPTD